jgi:hypothetical protein
VLKAAISSAWLRLVHFLAAVREKFLQVMGKFLDWLLKRKTKNTSGGRPTVDDESLSAHRDCIVEMLSSWWGELGWQLPRATTREELWAALEPVRDHSNRHRISRLLLVSSESATADQIRAGREANGRAIAEIYAVQEKQRTCMDLVNQAQMAEGQASAEQMKAVKAQLSKWQAGLEAAQREHEAACKAQDDLQKKLDLMEAGFAQDELLMFIDSRFIKGRYARNPENLANAIAGLPFTYGINFMGVWQSYARCSKLDCHPHHRFQVFETIQSVWRKSHKSKLPTVEFFYQEIAALPKTIKIVDPITKKESENKTENGVRSYLLNYWPVWRLAIEKSLESPVEQDRMPFLICANFTNVQRDPKTSLYMVLGAAEKTKNKRM